MHFSKTIISVMSVAALTTMGTLDALASTTDHASNVVTVTNHVKTKVSHVKTSYNTKKHAITIKGQTNAPKLTLHYKGKKVANVKVNAGKFAVTKKFKGYGTFKLMAGTKSLKKIAATRYSTPALQLTSAERTTKAMHYYVRNTKGAKLVISRKGKAIKTLKATGNVTKITLKNALIKNSSKHLTMTQRTRGLKTSRTIKIPALKVGVKTMVSYN